jgi:hypothetical protein
LEKEAKTFFRLVGGWISGEQSFLVLFSKKNRLLGLRCTACPMVPYKAGDRCMFIGENKTGRE